MGISLVGSLYYISLSVQNIPLVAQTLVILLMLFALSRKRNNFFTGFDFEKETIF